MAHFDNSHRISKQQFDNNSEDPDVIYRHPGISGENSPNGQVAYEALPMVLGKPIGSIPNHWTKRYHVHGGRVQNPNELYVLVSFALSTTRRDMTCTVLKVT